MMRRNYQSPTDRRVGRGDHCWFPHDAGFKCVLCGAVILSGTPPPCPTPKDFLPDTYERLTSGERALLPYVPKERLG